eukprot:jgi/Galph1/3432/GphlegSOOS_G2087.1
MNDAMERNTSASSCTFGGLLRQRSEHLLVESAVEDIPTKDAFSQNYKQFWPNESRESLTARDMDSAVVSHILVIGFHSTKGCCLEYIYPRLGGELDASSYTTGWYLGSDLASSVSAGGSPTFREEFNVSPSNAEKEKTELEKKLLRSLSILPAMALPDGVHERNDDCVYFHLEKGLFGVACFQQISSTSVLSFSADPRASIEQDREFASRGTVQKSVVMISRYPLYGILMEHLRPVVNVYFEQGDFRRTDILVQLFHSVNAALNSRQCLNSPGFLCHGLELRRLIRRLGFHMLRIMKLVLLEKKILFHGTPVESSSNAVVSLASVFPGTLPFLASPCTSNDMTCPSELSRFGFPLICFASDGPCVLEPYAPLQRLQQLLGVCVDNKESDNLGTNRKGISSGGGFLVGTSRNLGLLISSMTSCYDHPSNSMNESSARNFNAPDAIVDITVGRVHYAPWVEELCKLTKSERRFMENLIGIISNSLKSRLGRFRSSPEKYTDYLHSEEYARERIHEYLQQFLINMASTPGILTNDDNSGISSTEIVSNLMKSDVVENYGMPFCEAWVQTKTFQYWRKSCNRNIISTTKSSESNFPPKSKNNSPPLYPHSKSSSCQSSPAQGKLDKGIRRISFHGYHSDSGDDETTVSERLRKLASNLSHRWNFLGQSATSRLDMEEPKHKVVDREPFIEERGLKSDNESTKSELNRKSSLTQSVPVVETKDIAEST